MTLEAGRASTGGTGRWTPRISRRDLPALVLLAVTYYVAAKVGLSFALVERNVTPVWPPTGIALVAFLLFGRRLAPAVFVASFVVNVPITATWWAALGTAAGNTLGPLLAATLLKRVDFRVTLDRTRDALALVGIGALGCMAISATIGTAMLIASDHGRSLDVTSTWLVWWTGDAMGILIVAPFLLVIANLSRDAGRWRHRLEILIVSLAVLATCIFVAETEIPLLFLLLLVVGVVAWLFQLPGAAPAALIASGSAIYAASNSSGPFLGRTLDEQMIVLQAFNASLAMISLVFSAVVSDRIRARQGLEVAAIELEERVKARTAELTRTNQRLEREVGERERAEARLKGSERLLSQAQEVARIGSYRWNLRTGEVQWSDELFRIHGHEPQAFPVTFEAALSQVDPADRERIQANIGRALERGLTRLPDIEYRIERPDGDLRVVIGSARVTRTPDGRPAEMVGSVHDVTEQRAYEREHRIAETLQRALLPQHVAHIEGVEVATRYLPAEEGTHAGGDWYDVIDLDDERVAFVIGDVSGHGMHAASSMGQARMTVRAYALAGVDPRTVVSLTARALGRFTDDELATLIYLELDRTTGSVRLVVAGHPPPLLLDAEGHASYVEVDPGLPLGIELGEPEPYLETELSLTPGSALFLYTDGLIDRPDLPATEGLDRLCHALEVASPDDLERLCDEVLDAMDASTSGDDIAIACLRLVNAPLHLEIDADPAQLSGVRQAVRSWLEPRAVDPHIVDDVVLATSEATANAVEHAYRDRGKGSVTIDGTIHEDELVLVVRDHGSWATPRASDRGRGFTVIDAVMDGLEVDLHEDGTEVRLRRSLAPETPVAP